MRESNWYIDFRPKVVFASNKYDRPKRVIHKALDTHKEIQQRLNHEPKVA